MICIYEANGGLTCGLSISSYVINIKVFAQLSGDRDWTQYSIIMMSIQTPHSNQQPEWQEISTPQETFIN